MKLIMFTKSFRDKSVAETAQIVAGMGFSGLDLTVRPGGHVAPEQVEEQLPAAVQTAAQYSVTVPMISTNVTDAADPVSESIYRAAAASGVKYVKLGYYKYPGFGTARQEIARVREALAGIEELSRKYNLCSGLHLHSGDMMSCDGAVTAMLLEGRDPRYVGAYIDTGHMPAEGAYSAWKLGLDLLSDKVVLVAVKNFRYEAQKDEKTGQLVWKRVLVPLGQGLTRWDEFFGYLKQIGYDGYLSVHSEYMDGGSFRILSFDEMVQQTKDDVAFLRRFMW